MKVLVIGGGGLLGSFLLPKLVASGHDVVVSDNLTGSVKVTEHINLSTASATDIDAMRYTYRIHKPDVVFIAPAYQFSRDTIYNPYEDARLVLNSANVAASILTPNVKQVVFLSSGEVYGGPQTSRPLKESRKIIRSATQHGTAKLAAESVLEFRCHELGIPCVSLRVFDMFGPRKRFCPRTGVVSFLIDSFIRGELVGLRGARRLRDFVHAEDVAELCSTLASGGHEGVYNVGTGKGTTLIQVVKALAGLMEIPNAPVLMDDGPAPSFSSVADISRVQTLVPSWEPKYEIISCLPELVEFRTTTPADKPNMARGI
jgi:nucleoside-diphosphate-sugar epimerase